MRFKVGDTLLVPVLAGSNLTQTKKSPTSYDSFTQIDSEDHELFGILKGCKQVLKERTVPYCDCACLREQERRKIENIKR